MVEAMPCSRRMLAALIIKNLLAFLLKLVPPFSMKNALCCNDHLFTQKDQKCMQ